VLAARGGLGAAEAVLGVTASAWPPLAIQARFPPGDPLVFYPPI